MRLIDTRKIEHADWLEVRKTGIGGSDAAAAVGLSPYKSQLELWMEKTNRDAELPRPDPKDTTEPIYWGTMLEPIVAASYTQQTSNKVRKVNAVLRHPLFPFMLAPCSRQWPMRPKPGSRLAGCFSSAAKTAPRPTLTACF